LKSQPPEASKMVAVTRGLPMRGSVRREIAPSLRCSAASLVQALSFVSVDNTESCRLPGMHDLILVDEDSR
jgi:hypothetical protein